MSIETLNITSSNELVVDYFCTGSNSQRLLFTFTEFGNRDLRGNGFATSFALKSGFDVIAFKTNADDWYHGVSDSTFFSVNYFIESRKNEYKWRAGYGSSMGGYAAMLFANELRLDAVLALSPQFDISEDWDRRWANQASKISNIRLLTSDKISARCKYVVIYDPIDNDGIHAAKYKNLLSAENSQFVSLPYAGHPVGPQLRAAGCLKQVAMAAILGQKLPDIRERIRMAKREDANYYFLLAGHCLNRSRVDWANRLIQQAIKLRPLEPEIRIRAAQINEIQGRIQDALGHASLAVALSPRAPSHDCDLVKASFHLRLHFTGPTLYRLCYKHNS